jgi:bifunctional UDP-N-acetylglucosamine pyrophosphorylase/glucosamine-1-phosphate N-acetyltransferase
MSQKNIVGVIFAAGRGSRLQPLTDQVPKPLVEIQGKTLLEYQLENLQPLVSQFVIVVHWLQEQIKEKIGEYYQGKPVSYVFQENYKGGTMDSLRTGMSAVEGRVDGWVASNSDDLIDQVFYQKLAEHVQEKPGRAAMLGKEMEDLEKLSKFGVLKVDEHNQLQEIVEKPKEYVSKLINVGVYYFPGEIKQWIPAKSEGSEGEELITELVNQYNRVNPVVVVAAKGEYWPVSNLQDLESARQAWSVGGDKS